MKRTVVGFMAVLAFTVSTPQASWAASEVDALIEKLVEKGVLSKNEGIELKAEVAADAHIVREDELKRMLPEWVHNTKLKGDFRARYQYERKANDTDSRDRGRYRYRLGLESKVNDQVKVGAGLASGAEDPRSTNQTFQDTFERGDVRLNYAYGEYSPSPEISIIGGVFEKKKYLWTPDDMLWDSDINPTGGAVHLERKLVGNTKGFLNSGLFVLDESTSSDKPDPFIHYVQGGTKWKNSSEKVDATLAGTYYGFNAVKGSNLDWCAGTNTGRTSGSTSSGACTGAPIYDFDSVGGSLEVGVNQLFGGLPLSFDERISLFGDYIHNFDPSDNANGFAAGVKFGHKKVTNKKQWQARYQFTKLGKDAWFDALPDSDRLGGATDVYGHEGVLTVGVNKNVFLEFDYYQDQRITGAKNRAQVMQADLNFKF